MSSRWWRGIHTPWGGELLGVNSTPWGILQRPGLVETRAKYPLEEHVNTVEAPKREGGLRAGQKMFEKKLEKFGDLCFSYILKHLFRYLGSLDIFWFFEHIHHYYTPEV